jgi:hypothetical protein
MALRYLLDEHLRGILLHAFQQHNARGINPVDVTQVGDPADLPLGTQDPDVLLWCERDGRVVISLDRHTMPGHLAAHLQQGHHCPGVFILQPGYTVAELVDVLVLAAHIYDPAEVQDQVTFLP